MIYVVATLTVKPETRAEFIAAATACIKETRKEPGNIAYDMHESVTDPTKMVFVEQWENVEATVPHGKAEHMRTFGRVAVKCMTAPPRIDFIANLPPTSPPHQRLTNCASAKSTSRATGSRRSPLPEGGRLSESDGLVRKKVPPERLRFGGSAADGPGAQASGC